MSKTYNEALLQRVEEYLASSGLSQNKMAQAVVCPSRFRGQ